MGRKQTGGRKLICFCVAGLILFIALGCTVLTENQKVEVRNEDSQTKENAVRCASEDLDENPPGK